MAVNQFLEFATDPLAFIETLAEYLADVERTAGQQSGIARAELNNRALRQGSAAAAGLGEFVKNQGFDFLDDGNTAARAQAIQDAISALIQPSITVAVNEAKINVLQAVFPVGSFYASATVNTNPRNLLGFGTWVRVEGRMILGASSSYAAGTEGGAANVTLSVNNMPAHSHTASSSSAGGHTHTATTASAGAHTHSVSGTAAQAGSHTHTATTGEAGEHSHTASSNSAGGHSHTATTSNAGAHTHNRGTMNITGTFFSEHNGYPDYSGAFYIDTNQYPNRYRGIDGGDGDNTLSIFDASRSWSGNTNSAGGHTHTLTTNNAGAHSHTITVGNAGKHTHKLTTASAGAHTHTVSATAASAGGHTHTLTTASAGAHTHTITIGNTGSGAAFSVLNPYFAAYIWRRTA